MIYITVRQSPVYRQMTLEEYLFQNYQGTTVVNNNVSNTKTYEFERASEHLRGTLMSHSSSLNWNSLTSLSPICDSRSAVLCTKPSTFPKGLEGFAESTHRSRN